MAIFYTAQPKSSTRYPIYLGHCVDVNNENIKISLSENSAPSAYNYKHFKDGIVFKIYASASLDVIEILKKNIKASLSAKGIFPIKGSHRDLDWYDYKKGCIIEIDLPLIIHEEIRILKKKGYEIELYEPPKIIEHQSDL